MITYVKKDLSTLFNIGDSLCTPDVYFDIKSDNDVRFIGGGVWDIRKYGSDPLSNKTVLWAAGQSFKEVSKMIDTSGLSYMEWSIRDRDLLTDKSKFVPCVSCFHEEILKAPTDSKTLIFTNANLAVSNGINLSETADRMILKNSTSYEEFIQKWSVCDRIITNSYHGIYWALLSGREVSPFGYSSKFVSLFSLFNLEFPQSQRYKIKDKATLGSMIMSKNKQFYRIENYSQFLEEFKDINMSFIHKLERHGIECKIKQ